MIYMRKSNYEEIKGKWGELTQAQQLALSEALAGKTQAQVFQSLMKNWNRVREFQEAYNKGWTIGSAQREKQHSPYVQKCAQDIDLIAGNP